MADANASKPRPLSPHLGIYRLTVTMVMSIVHRITGAALYFGTLLLAAWLVAISEGQKAFDVMHAVFANPLGKLVLFGYTWALLHHMFGGIRHFIWDTGRGFDLKTADRLGWATLVLSLGGTALVWYYALVGSR